MSAPQVPGLPYKGLTPFEDSEVDATFFFGREREREIITANLMASRLTVLYGASGVGKSSVLRAGVSHELRAEARANLAETGERELAAIVFSSWSGDPVRELRAAVAAELFGGSNGGEAGEGSLADVFQEWTTELNLDLYLVLDQAEEYFLYHGSEGGEGTFVEDFPELVTRPGLRVNALLSLREDALATLDSFKAKIPNLLANRLRLDHLDRSAARAAIEGPLEAYNLLVPEEGRAAIEPALVEAVLDQVTAGTLDYGGAGRGRARGTEDVERVETPYLQLVMQRLWEVEEGARPRTLRLATLERLGGAQRIVEDHLDDALETLTPGEKDAAAGMFHYLVTPSGTKIAHAVGDLRRYAAVSEPEVRGVLKRLSDERILRPISGGGDGDGGSYEIYHDVLADAVLAWRGRHEAERELERTKREAERRHRRALIVAGAALVALVAMAAVTVFALTQRSEARSQRSAARSQARHARARELAATALTQLPVDPERSLRLAVDAARLEHTPQVEDALRDALLAARLRRILPAGGPVTDASFSRDGRRVVTGSRDGNARLYDARTGRLLHVLPAKGPVTAVSYSPDGRVIVTAAGHAARLWDARRGGLLHVLPHRGAVSSAEFGPYGRFVVTAGNDRTARIWRVADGRPLHVLSHRQPVLNATFSLDGRLVLTLTYGAADVYSARTGRLLRRLEQPGGLTSASFNSTGGIVVTTSANHRARLWRLWRIPEPELLHVLKGHVGRVTTASFGPYGGQVVTASTDGTARVWSVSTGELVAVLPGHTSFVTGAVFSPDGKSVVTASRDRTATIFDSATGRLLVSLLGHTDAVIGASYDSAGDRVVTASDDSTARIWDPTAPQLRRLGRHNAVLGASFSRDGRFVVSAGGPGARIWSVGSHRLLRRLPQPGSVTSASFSSDGARVLTTSRGHTARIWTWRRGTFRVLRHNGSVTAGAFSPDGRLVATASTDGRARIWSAESGRRLFVLRQGPSLDTVSFSPDNKLLVAGGGDGTASIWDAHTGRLVHALHGHSDDVVAAVFSPSGRLVATASNDTTARIWDADTGVLLHILSAAHRVTSVSFSPRSDLVATTSVDPVDNARIWSTKTGRTLHRLVGQSAVNAASFSRDGRWLITAGPGKAALWQTQTGRLLIYLSGHAKPAKGARGLESASFSPEGRRILTASDDGTVRLYTCGICARIPGLVRLAESRLAQVARGLTPEQRRRYLP